MSTLEYMKATFTTLHGSRGMSWEDMISAVSPVIGAPTENDCFYASWDKITNGVPSPEGTWAPVQWKDGLWALRYTLSHAYDYDDEPLVLTLEELGNIRKQAETFATAAGFEPGKTVFTSYSWYNGVDEPDISEQDLFSLQAVSDASK